MSAHSDEENQHRNKDAEDSSFNLFKDYLDLRLNSSKRDLDDQGENLSKQTVKKIKKAL